MAETLTRPAMLTLTEAAEFAGVSRATIWRRITSGELPAIRVGHNRQAPIRIRRDELEAYLFGPADHEEKT